MTILQSIFSSVQAGNTMLTELLVAQALDERYPPAEILRKGLAAGLIKTMKRFHLYEIFDSEVLLAERAVKAGIHILMPALEKTQGPSAETVITGTLEGDIREIEKDICSILMKSLGLKVIDLGTSVTNTRFVEAATEERARLLVCSTSLTTFLPQMKALVQAATQANIRTKTKILLSGAPVTEQFCKSIGADLYAPDVLLAADIAVDYCKNRYFAAAASSSAKMDSSVSLSK